jgi:coenzyme F420-reducing hydrogenase beta subunit
MTQNRRNENGLFGIARRFFSDRGVRYFTGCALSVLIKVALTNLLVFFLLPVEFSYLLVHVVILFYSFLYHGHVTFPGGGVTVRHFFKFTFAVILLKVVDYFLVVKAAVWFEGTAGDGRSALAVHTLISLAVVVVSGLIFVVRYFLYRYIFTDAAEDASSKYEYYTGPVRGVYCGYSSRADQRDEAASGGVVSACMIELLKSGRVDGCLLYRLENIDGKLEVVPVIASSEEEVLSCQGSIYIYFPPINGDVVSMVKGFEGRVAVVGLPCGIAGWRKKMEMDSELADKIEILVGLFCGHTSRKILLERVFEKKGIDEGEVRRFRFRMGLWRGESWVEFADGRELRFSSKEFTVYQNLFVHSHPGCLRCVDHYADQADVSVGDIWLREFKGKGIKHSVFAARSDKGVELVDKMVSEGVLEAGEVDLRLMYRANKRAAVFHKASSAKAVAGKLYGIGIKRAADARPVRWNELLAAIIFVGMYKLSESRYSALIFKLPRGVLWVVLAAGKLLTNF